MSVLEAPRESTVEVPSRRAIRERREARPPGFFRGVLRGIGLGLFVLILAVAASVTVVPLLVGAVPLTVLSGSMVPTLHPGDVVVSQRIDPGAIRVGDIVTFQPNSDDPTLITHRVIAQSVGESGPTLTTQGDANNAADTPILTEQVRGRMLYSVPRIGYLTHAVPAEIRTVLPSIAGVALIAYAISTFFRRPRGADSERTSS